MERSKALDASMTILPRSLVTPAALYSDQMAYIATLVQNRKYDVICITDDEGALLSLRFYMPT